MYPGIHKIIHTVQVAIYTTNIYIYIYINIYYTKWQCFHSLHRIFTAVMYLAFLGLVVLLLVSVFIAQANGCYNNVKDIADQMANYSCARLLTQTSTMLPVWVFNAITVSSLMCNSVHCTISILIYNYYITIRIVILLMALIYHPPFYHNRRSVHVKLHLTYGLIGHVRVALTRLFCEAFGK